MIVEVRLPEISENVASGDVTKVLVKVGDRVEVDQPLVELETEKAVFEVPSTAAGVVTEIRLKPGDSVDVGGVIAKIDTEAKADAQQQAAPAEKPTARAASEPSEPKPTPAPTQPQSQKPAAPSTP